MASSIAPLNGAAAPGSSSDGSKTMLLFGGGILLGSALAFGAAYAMTRYNAERDEEREYRELRRRRQHRPVGFWVRICSRQPSPTGSSILLIKLYG